ncbi:MAG: RtcB family protein, partial [Thermoplasmata archaeon]
MHDWNGPVKKLDDFRYEIPQKYKNEMRTRGIIYADEKMIRSVVKDNAPEQVANVATLPGIVGSSMAMPDIHWGYGFPIGGVAAFSMDDGVVSPGGVGFDINCGVRMLTTNMNVNDVTPKIKDIVNKMFENVPSGVGSRGKIRVDNQTLRRVLEEGAGWAVSEGYGWEDDIEHLEENGCYKIADSEKVSQKAIERGKPQLGSLG